MSASVTSITDTLFELEKNVDSKKMHAPAVTNEATGSLNQLTIRFISLTQNTSQWTVYRSNFALFTSELTLPVGPAPSALKVNTSGTIVLLGKSLITRA